MSPSRTKGGAAHKDRTIVYCRLQLKQGHNKTVDKMLLDLKHNYAKTQTFRKVPRPYFRNK